ncbi:hypothetical protein F511_06690 [Dorcoceras hygrometricum]|uniref:Uncharacterized protein n=1 Tax=Dorcoceras hygrometricum TaxID=472368 RepID=A0A2Z7BWT2_9LAMI|nr:hypothetical protein F511_06690 [Dorcoceras hygrometricum]
MAYVSPSSSSEGSTRRFDLHIVYRPDPAFMEVRTSMAYVSPSSSSEGSTRRFDLHIVYRPDPATSSCENS